MYVHSFLPVNSNTIFATIEADSKDKSEIRKIELNDTTTTNIWISRTIWKTIWDSHQDKAVLSSSADKLYVFLNIDYVKLFVSLNTTDGSVVGDRFVSSNTANWNYQFIDCMVLFGGKIYITIRIERVPF